MKLQVKKAATDVTLYIFIQDSTSTTGAGKTGLVYNTASLVCYYVRPLASAAALSLVTQTVTGAHSDGGFVEVDATNMPGVYRLDLSDAVVATGVNSVVLMLKGATGMVPLIMEIMLTAYDPQDATGLGLSRIDDTISSRASQTSVNTLDDFVDTEVAAIKTKTDNLPNNPAATTDIPTAGAIADAVWDETFTGHNTDDTYGLIFHPLAHGTVAGQSTNTVTLDGDAVGTNNYYNGAIIQLVTGTGAGQARVISGYVGSTKVATLTENWGTQPNGTTKYTVWPGGKIGAVASVDAGVTVTTNNDKTGYALSTAGYNAVADQVWDEVLSGHLTGGTTGAALNSAGSSGDPWGTALPGAYSAGTAGNILGNNLNATVSSRATQTSVDTVDDFLDTEIAAIKDKTDNLPASPAAVSDIPSASTVATAVWASGTRTLSSFGTLISDIWSNATRTLSAFGFTVTTDVSSTVSTNLNATVGSRATPADVLAQVNGALDASQTELTTVPTSTGTLRSMIKYGFAKVRNRIVVNKGTGASTVYREDSTTALGAATFTDNGTILDKGKDS